MQRGNQPQRPAVSLAAREGRPEAGDVTHATTIYPRMPWKRIYFSRSCLHGSAERKCRSAVWACLRLFLQIWSDRERRTRASFGFTAAHRSLPFGTRVRVTSRRSGRSVVLRINDRGPFVRGRVIDVTPAGARALGFSGLAPVTVAVAN